MFKHKSLLVLIMLLLAGIACYSDSPLWWNELTPTPPAVTPLPTAPPDQTRLKIGDVAYAPASVTEAAFRLDLTKFPEPLRADLSNKSPQSCSQNSVVKILYTAMRPEGTIYDLVDCSGVVGWTPERSLLGPIEMVVNDRALTTEAGLDENNAYKIEVSDPPYREDDPFRQKADCRVNDTVDVIAMSGFSTGELYYKIRCTNPINPGAKNVGWVTAKALFGPVRFRNGETGIIPQDFETVRLSPEPNGSEIAAICQPDELVHITDTPVQRIENDLYYELECTDGVGWSNQDFLLGPIAFTMGERVLVTVPGVSNSALAAATPEVEVSPEAALPDEELPTEAAPTFPAVPITAEPGPLLLDNQVGECKDASVTTIQDFAGVDDQIYVQVECDGVSGWLEQDVLYGSVEYEIGETVLLGENALLGFNQRGIYLSIELFDIEGSSGGGSVIAGECAFDFDAMTPVEATLIDVGYYRTSTGNVVGVFYRASCVSKEGSIIEGWINQSRIGE